jgi:histidinol phosphatase-like enzyme (inositol monophosphatase family)
MRATNANRAIQHQQHEEATVVEDDARNARLALAREVAQQAGELIMSYFDARVPVERKADDSPVTVADREAERFLRSRIEEAFPEDAILGEEQGTRPGRSGYRWILDPIDGTKSFIAGVPLFGTLVAVQAGEQAVVGVIELPALQTRLFAARGQGAWVQTGNSPPQRARVSTQEHLADGLYLTSEVATFRQEGLLEVHQQLEAAAWYARTWGDCYGYYLVATGRAVAMVDPALCIWDAAALQPILLESGGTFTDWSGHESIDPGRAVATNGRVLSEVLAITRPATGRLQGRADDPS